MGVNVSSFKIIIFVSSERKIFLQNRRREV